MRATASALSSPPAVLDAHRWWTLAVILSATFMSILDNFIVNVAIPTIQHDLGATVAQIEFVVAGYTLAYAVLLITGGRLGDIAGRKRLFMLGMAGFVVASALCGFAPTANLLIAFRVVQGLSAALMVPQVLAILQVTFPAGEERARALSIYSAVIGVAAGVGQVVGGILVKSDLFGLGWRPVFLINVPVGIAALIAAAVLLRETQSGAHRRLDVAGVGIATVTVLLLTYPLVVGREAGWPAWVFVSLAASAAGLFAFIRFEQWLSGRGGTPLIELALFRQRTYVVGVCITILSFAFQGGFFLLVAFYLQSGLHVSPLRAGLTLAPMAVMFFLGSFVTPRLIRRFGGRGTLLLGGIINPLGVIILMLTARQIGVQLQGPELIPGFVVTGFGQACVVSAQYNVVFSEVRGEQVGSASGVLTTMQQVATAVGVAVVGIIFFGLLNGARDGAAYVRAFTLTLWFPAAMTAAIALLTLLLPATPPALASPVPVVAGE